MVRDDIVGGIKVAMSKGASLQAAMQSFYNAGYNKDEIDEAARFIMSNQSPSQFYNSPQVTPLPQTPPPKQAPPQIPISPQPYMSQPQNSQNLSTPQNNPNQIQKVSSYPVNLPRDPPSSPKKSKSKVAIIILLSLILFLLIGSLVAVFLFKDQILSLFG